MQSKDSGKFFIGSLVIFGVLYVVVLLILHTATSGVQTATSIDSMDETAISERLQPVGQETVGEETVAVAAAPTESAAAADDDSLGKQIASTSCAACHGSGLMNAPRIGSSADWAPRLEQGIETLYTHALDGFNLMPARGGNANLSDDEVKAAVDYMVASAK